MSNPTRIKGELVLEDSVSHNINPTFFKDKLQGTTPKVSNVNRFVCNNAGATTVTQFVGGAEGQTIKILGDGNTTITNGTNIFTNTGANKLLLDNVVYTFTLFNTIWYEDE